MKFLEYSTRFIKGAYLYAPDTTEPLPLVVWLDGGTGREPHKTGLGKLLADGSLTPSCLVLMPCSARGYTLKNVPTEELWFLIDELKKTHSVDTVSIVGWSNGSDATAQQVASKPSGFFRVCLISNYTKQWDKRPEAVTAPVRILLGAREKSAARNRSWPIVDRLADCKLYRVDPYDHQVGAKIWTDERFQVLDWLTGGTDDIQKGDEQA